mmetsp:Transcript_29481/g.62004  ORF Transcript_29481/g.62004 Transcript_29481/m.62004 type:complete len:233 (-) Transcript_29481:188-886(-)|eukprot:CAMPEP_0171342214 /NCGR_PEP_ID=MMETSP0878-20121228/13646_1 /TAXON_ID=67004 /ORGANISM="Thalassiosira weissflogii, Strain CCMP1336" /LENGTH=232 /DNA_ID=CAMNT_0011844811 /DNA_START=138 /DNA_END=836 /DNA_ORIENTATION=+
MKLQILAVLTALNTIAVTDAFFPQPGIPAKAKRSSTKCAMTIVSPFANSEDGEDVNSGGESVSTATYTPLPSDDEPLDLTWDNVDMVLEEMRPYLLQDGGNVAISEIDGPIVRLELQGACGTCPSSTQTMKMGLERKLKERIPEIQEVIQALPDTPDLDEDQVNVVLDSVRPFLQVAGGTIDVASITGEGGLQPTITLKMEGNAASLKSVRLEIAQRLQRHFMISGLRVDWA